MMADINCCRFNIFVFQLFRDFRLGIILTAYNEQDNLFTISGTERLR